MATATSFADRGTALRVPAGRAIARRHRHGADRRASAAATRSRGRRGGERLEQANAPGSSRAGSAARPRDRSAPAPPPASTAAGAPRRARRESAIDSPSRASSGSQPATCGGLGLQCCIALLERAAIAQPQCRRSSVPRGTRPSRSSGAGGSRLPRPGGARPVRSPALGKPGTAGSGIGGPAADPRRRRPAATSKPSVSACRRSDVSRPMTLGESVHAVLAAHCSWCGTIVPSEHEDGLQHRRLPEPLSPQIRCSPARVRAPRARCSAHPNLSSVRLGDSSLQLVCACVRVPADTLAAPARNEQRSAPHGTSRHSPDAARTARPKVLRQQCGRYRTRRI